MMLVGLPTQHILWSLQTKSLALWGERDALCVTPPATLQKRTGKHIGQASLNPGHPHRLPEWISSYQYWATFCCWKILLASSGVRKRASGTALGMKRPGLCPLLPPAFPYTPFSLQGHLIFFLPSYHHPVWNKRAVKDVEVVCQKYYFVN